MAAEDYWCLCVEVAAAERDPLVAWLAQRGHCAFEERDGAQGVQVLLYDASERALARLEASIQADYASRSPSAPRCALSRVDPSWSLRWTDYLEPVQLTPRLRLVPTAAPASGARPDALYLEPAFAFGFGEHASTRLAAAWLEERCAARPGASVLDVGTGTGVLALVAARSGAGRVLGIDTSDEAVHAARRNAAHNAAPGCRFASTPLADVPGSFELVVANVEAGVQRTLAAALAARLRHGSELALAGFVRAQSAGLVRAFATLGVVLCERACEGDWVLLASGPRA